MPGVDSEKQPLLGDDATTPPGGQYGERTPNSPNQEEPTRSSPTRGFEISPGQIKIESSDSTKFSFKKLLKFTGPGFLMSIAYLDPGNIESDLQSGAIAKYKLLWVLMWSTIMGLILQLLAARLGCVTGMNLGEVCRLEYPKMPRIVLWLMIEIAIIGSDIQEVIGSAIAINLLSNKTVPIWAGVLITGFDTFTFLFLESAGLRKLEALFGTLITAMAGSFLYMYITVKPNQGDIIIGLWFPWCTDCHQDAIEQLVGIVGAVIMPHNIYLHSALVLSRDIDRKEKKNIREANMYYSIESAIALFLSFMINLFVVATFAEAFSDRDDSDDASLRKAGDWINVKYGFAMKIIWGIGILAAGQSSTMTGTYAGQFVMQGFLNIQWAKWKRVLLTRSIAIIPTIIVAIAATSDLDDLSSWLNVLQSVQLPFALLPILHFTSNERIMGEFKNGKMLKFCVWTLAVVVMGINFYLVFLFLNEVGKWYVYLIASFIIVGYLIFVAYLALGITLFSRIKLKLMLTLGLDVSKLQDQIQTRTEYQYTKIDSVNQMEERLRSSSSV